MPSPWIKAVNFLFSSVGISEIGAKYDADFDRERDGWRDITPGTQLEGWRRVSASRSAPLPEASPWIVDGDTVRAVAGELELLQFQEPLADFVFHVEWRVRQDFPEGVHYPGIVARMSVDGGLWHAATLGGKDSGFLIANTQLAGKEQRVDLRFQVEKPRVRPANWWNAYEIHASAGRIRTWVNDGWTCDLTKCEIREGCLAIAALPQEIEYRRLSLKLLP